MLNLETQQDSVFNFLARINNVVVGTSGLIIKEASVYLVGANVLSLKSFWLSIKS